MGSRRAARPSAHGASSAWALGSRVTACAHARVVARLWAFGGPPHPGVSPGHEGEEAAGHPVGAPRSGGADGCQTARSSPPRPPAPTPEGATRTRELWGWGARARGGFAQVSSGGHRERDLRPQGSEVCLSNLPSSLRPGDGQRATLGCLSSGPQGTEVGQAVSARPILCPLASVTWKVILRAPGREAGAVVERQVLGQTLAWLPRCAQGREGAEALPMPRSSPFWKFPGCRWSQ